MNTVKVVKKHISTMTEAEKISIEYLLATNDKNVIFTKHAKDRAKERDVLKHFTINEIQSVVKNHNLVEFTFDGKKKNNKVLLESKQIKRGKKLIVSVNLKKHTILTFWLMNANANKKCTNNHTEFNILECL